MTMSRLRRSTSVQANSARHQATARAEPSRTLLRLLAPAFALAIGLASTASYAADASAPGAPPAVTAAPPSDKTDGPQLKTTDTGPTFKPNPGPDVRVIPPPDKAVPGPTPLMAPAGVTALSGLILSSDGVALP